MTTNKKPFLVGDRVRVYLSAYNQETGVIHHIYDDGMISMRNDIGGNVSNILCHPKQLRRLKPKQKHPMEGKTFYASEIGNSYNMHNYLTANTNYSFTVSNIKRLKK